MNGVQLNNSVADTGIKRDYPILLDGVTWSSGVIATASGSRVATFDDNAEVGIFNFHVPESYDDRVRDTNQSWPADTIELIVLAESVTAITSTLEFDDFEIWRKGEATLIDPTGFTAFTTGQVVISSLNLAEYNMALSGLDVRAGDSLGIALGCTIASGSIKIVGLKMRIRELLVMKNIADR